MGILGGTLEPCLPHQVWKLTLLVHVRVIHGTPISQERMGCVTLTIVVSGSKILIVYEFGESLLKASPYADGHAVSTGSQWPFPATLDLLPPSAIPQLFSGVQGAGGVSVAAMQFVVDCFVADVLGPWNTGLNL